MNPEMTTTPLDKVTVLLPDSQKSYCISPPPPPQETSSYQKSLMFHFEDILECEWLQQEFRERVTTKLDRFHLDRQ